MKNQLIILLIAISLFSCKKEDNNISKKEKTSPIGLKVNEVIPKSDMGFDIISSNLKNKVLVLEIAHGGGCDPNHNFKMYNNYNPTSSDCNGKELYLVFKTKDFCKRLDYSTLTFDLTDAIFCNNRLIIKGAQKDLEITI